MKPWSMGLAPDLQRDLKLVFKPIAARAATIKNLLTVFIAAVKAAGRRPMLVKPDITRKKTINQGKMDLMLTFADLLSAFCFFLIWRLIAAKTRTAGMMERVLVSFTMVAKSPAASLKA